jgi:hypothetical protein
MGWMAYTKLLCPLATLPAQVYSIDYLMEVASWKWWNESKKSGLNMR